MCESDEILPKRYLIIRGDKIMKKEKRQKMCLEIIDQFEQLLEEKDMYGYEMIETLQKKSQNVFQLKAGTLYPLLHTLEGKGYLTSYEDSTGQKVRKYYSITKSGKNFLSQKKEEWKEYSAAVANILTSRLTGSADVISSYVPQLEG